MTFIWFPGLSYVEAACHCLADWEALGGPGAGAELLMSGVKVQKNQCCLPTGGWTQVLGLMPAYWQAGMGPGYRA